MDRFAIFVDAGYFFAAGSNAAFNEPLKRHEVSLKTPEKMLSDLHNIAKDIADDLPLLRVYWYDATTSQLTMEQSLLALLPSLKLKLGSLNSAGQQKGVDSVLVADLIELARNRAIASAVIIAGDEDIRIAVQIAQSFGVRVHILAAGDPTRNVSKTLQMEADSLSSLDGKWFAVHLERKIAPQSAAASSEKLDVAAVKSVAADISKEILGGLTPSNLSKLLSHFKTHTIVPAEYDRPLIARVSESLSFYKLSGSEKRIIRGVFVNNVKDMAQNSN